MRRDEIDQGIIESAKIAGIRLHLLDDQTSEEIVNVTEYEILGRRSCFVCEKVNSSFHRNCVHHLNGNPLDNRRFNLMTMCRKCHSRVHTAYHRQWKESHGIVNGAITDEKQNDETEVISIDDRKDRTG